MPPPTEEQGRVSSVDSFHWKDLSNCVSAHMDMGEQGVAVHHKQKGEAGMSHGEDLTASAFQTISKGEKSVRH